MLPKNYVSIVNNLSIPDKESQKLAKDADYYISRGLYSHAESSVASLANRVEEVTGVQHVFKFFPPDD